MSDGIAAAMKEWLLANRDAQVGFLAELVRMPSDNPPGDCAVHAQHTALLLESLGLTVERHDVPAEKAREAGMIAVTNLIVRHRFGDGPVVALNAHGDVVPPGDGWTQDPYGAAIVDGWMYGRGAAVSKSDFATYAFALLALRHMAERGLCQLHGTVELHFTYDEEVGGEVGPLLLLQQGLSKPDLVIGAGFSHGVVTAHNGCLHLDVQLIGKSAHAALPSAGIDALQAASTVLVRLYAWREALALRFSPLPGIGAPQLTIGMIAGGINTNVVPDLVTFRLDRRITPDEDAAEAEAELRDIIENAAAEVPGIRVSIKRILLALPLTPEGSARPLTKRLCARASEVLGEDIGETAVPLYTDARHYAAHCVPTVLYGAGPRTIEEANAHRADERLPLSDLFAATEVVALALHDFLSVTQPTLTVGTLSTMPRDEFVRALHGIWEHSPWVAERAWEARPFADAAALHAAMVHVVEVAFDDEKLALIRAHPELAGCAALKGELTAESQQEQGRAGLDQCSPEELETLTELNRRYTDKFGFPFVVAVSGHTRSSIISAFEQRLQRSAEQEHAECLTQIAHIAWLRVKKALLF